MSKTQEKLLSGELNPSNSTPPICQISASLLLKETFGTLLDKCGGATKVSDYTRVGQSALYQMASGNENKHFPPVDVVASLERISGQPIVTKVLAELSGYALMPIKPMAVKGSFSGILAKLGKEVSDVFSDSAKALEDDDLTPIEAKGLIQDVDEAIAVLQELKSRLRHVSEDRHTVFHELMEA